MTADFSSALSYSYYSDYYTDFNTTNGTEYVDHSDDDDITINVAYKIGFILTQYYTPAFSLLGSFGNILSVVVFFKTKLRKLSSSYYLAALGISDTGFLLASIVPWLNFISIDIYNKEVFCQLFTYFSGLCSFLSVWFIVAFTVERFIAVRYPLKRQTMCTVKRACTVLIGLIVLGSIICIPLLIYSAPVYSEYADYIVCDVRKNYKYQMQIYNYIDTLLVFVIPFTTIVVLNAFTAVSIWRVAGVRRTMIIQNRRHSDERSFRRNGQIKKSAYANLPQWLNSSNNGPKNNASSSQIKVTKMLLIVSTVFVCLNLPSYIMRIIAFLIESDQHSQATIITQYICWFFFYTNFGINFALYCLSGQNFRKAVVSMFSMLKERSTFRKQDRPVQTLPEFLEEPSSLKYG